MLSLERLDYEQAKQRLSLRNVWASCLINAEATVLMANDTIISM